MDYGPRIPNQHRQGFTQKHMDSLDLRGESLSEAWTCFKDLLQRVPHRGIDLWLQVQIFYDHVNPVTRRTIDQSAGGKLRDRNAKESWALLEGLALYDNESWNDPRDFAKLVKAIPLPQDVPSTSDRHLIELENQVQRLLEALLAPTQPNQVNKITTSCEICSGPHDTQYCMEDPEQAFVEYASSRTNEAGGSLPSDTVKNPKLSNSPVLSARSYPTGESQWSTHIHGSINTITIHPKQPNDSCDSIVEEEEQEREGDPKDTNTIAYIEERRDMPLLERKDITAVDETKEITFKTPYKDPERSELSSEGHNLLSSRVILSEYDYDRGCRKPSDLEEGFYRDTIKLGPKYVTRIDDEGEVM
ncbi:hypothetical protein Tco_1458625 [Tanacetum coccineum]